MDLDEAQKKKLHKLHLDSKALLESLADRLPEQQLKSYRTFSFVGEWTELVEGLCASLVKRQIAITPAERDALAAVLAMFHTPMREHNNYINDADGTLAALNVVE